MDVFGSKKELNLKALPPSMTPTITSDADEVTGPWLFPQRGLSPMNVLCGAYSSGS
jgi:hypothetical protein